MDMEFLKRNKRYDILVTAIIMVAIYYLYFIRHYFSGNIVIGGDTQLLWSFNYLSLYSLKYYGEFLWWDPTTLNGWPAYVNQISGWFNYLGPFTLPSLVLFKLSSLFGVSINGFLVFQKTIFYFILNILAIILICRVLIQSRIARILPPLIFTLSAIQFHGFRDSVLYEAMPAPLFFVLALIYFDRHRSPKALVALLVAAGLFAASLNYGVLQTSFWWAGLFTLFLLAFSPRLLPDGLAALRSLYRQDRGPVILWLGLAVIGLGLLAFFLPVLLNLGELVRFDGSRAVDYDVGHAGGFGGGLDAALAHPLWTTFLYWAPSDAIHDVLLAFDDKGDGARSGVDHRYIGLVTLPLLFAALIRRHGQPVVWALVLSAFGCVAFVALARLNPAMVALADHVALFQNVRTIAETLPRDGPIILLAIAAGIGLDALLSDGRNAGGDGRERRDLERLLRAALLLLAGVALLCFLASLVPIGSILREFAAGAPGSAGGAGSDIDRMDGLRAALSHIAIYLFAFAFLCLLLSAIRAPAAKQAIGLALILVAFADLTLSADGYWKRGMVWYDNTGPHALPNPPAIGPIDSPLETWPGTYAGFIHNPYAGPFLGLRTWLVLATRPDWQHVLANYDPEDRIMRRYPDFRFLRGGSYLPHARIRDIDSLPPPERDRKTAYLHDPALAQAGAGREGTVPAVWEVTGFTPNRVEVSVRMPEDGIMVSLDNYDRFWTASVNGAAVPVSAVDFTFKGIALPAGDHVVRWQYDPWPVQAVWILYYLALLVLLATIAGLGRRRTGLAVVLAAVLFFGGNQVLVWPMAAQAAPAPGFRTATIADGRIVTIDGAGHLDLPFNRRIPLEAGRAGALEAAGIDAHGLVTIRGWAVDESQGSGARIVVVAIGDRLWRMTPTWMSRPDIGGINRGFGTSGFLLQGRGAKASDLRDLRAFVLLADGTARELDNVAVLPRVGE